MKTTLDMADHLREENYVIGNFSGVNSIWFDDADWQSITFKNCLFFKASFVSSIWKKCTIESCLFVDCDLTGTSFFNCEISAKFVNCTEGFTIEDCTAKDITITKYSDDMVLQLLESESEKSRG